MTFSADDLDNIILCVWRESRNQSEAGMRAVCHVIKNRVGASGFPKTIHDVIYQQNAFTSMSVSSDSQYNLDPPANDPQYAYIESIAPDVLSGNDPDPTNGAHYYGNLKYCTSGWFARVISGPDGNGTLTHPKTAQIDAHSFYI